VGAILLLTYTRHELFFAINGNYSDIGDKLMYYTTFLGQGEVIVPALLLMMIVPKFMNWQYFATAACCNLIPFAIQQGLKTIFSHPRPQLLYYSEVDKMHFLHEWPVMLTRSFPSGHSQGAFSFFCFLSLLLPKRYNKLGIIFFFMALAVCYSRIYLTAHFVDDVYSGSLLGTLLTTIIFSIADRYNKGRFS
jgi:membrane-associated phospholipid phosphatase